MNDTADISAIVLAAGRSSRMGRFKPLMRLEGRTLLEHTVSFFRKAGIKDIHVVLGHRADLIASGPLPDRVKVVVNHDYAEGMFSSVKTGIRELPTACRRFFIHPVDIPRVQPSTLVTLIRDHAKSAARIARPCVRGRCGHPPLISTELVPDILAWNGSDGLRGFLRRQAAITLNVPVTDEAVLMDLDTPEDFKNWSKVPNRDASRADGHDNFHSEVKPMNAKSPDKPGPEGLRLTRRGFLTTIGTGAVTVAASGHFFSAAEASNSTPVLAPSEMAKITLNVNRRDHHLLVETRWSLLHVLREVIGLTGTKSGCGRGECGACTVLVDGVARYACLTLAVEAQGAAITTVEGLLDGESLGPVQTAFAEEDAYQCGYCTPGQIMSVEGLLRQNPAPSLEDVRTAVSGNLCRCGAYAHIFKAAARAAKMKKA